MRMTKKYPKKYIYFKKKDTNFLKNRYQNSIIMEYWKITTFSKKLEKNNSETVTNEPDKEIPKERYISPKEKKSY